jgi:hypothetical protein
MNTFRRSIAAFASDGKAANESANPDNAERAVDACSSPVVIPVTDRSIARQT